MLIALGDKHTGGGSVITGSPDSDIDGMQVARIGDKAVHLLHKGVFPIVAGDGTLIIYGQVVPCQVGKSAAANLEH
ncbi:PAAR domain-containing protein [Stenotrophomonas sp. RAC2]|uniref:PAAR domain-containing protein n=1 Tax=Stenotrophomonas sp. RAC2 TaxID=3064902 RepID=UPI002724F38B|nr:PAAR domain-containing protein [Stenotrophomonas sp. RAC2]MDV9042026.1 PAAR domain-containing protein [Stenotrophomonas sp. RAC2]